MLPCRIQKAPVKRPIFYKTERIFKSWGPRNESAAAGWPPWGPIVPDIEGLLVSEWIRESEHEV